MAAGRTALPRVVRRIGIPVAGIFLVSCFIFLGFPYEELGDRIVSELRRSSGVKLEFQTIGPSFQLTGPVILTTGLRAILENGQIIEIDRAALRPAFSLAWLRGDPAIHTSLEKASGRASGTLILGDSGGWVGEIEQADMADLPISQLADLPTFTGVVDASIDLLQSESGPDGRVTFVVSNGSISIVSFPIAIPFETITGDLAFGDDAYLVVERFDLAGPLMNGGVSGSVLEASSFAQAPLRLEVQMEGNPAAAAAMRSAGFRVDRNGKAKLRITGTVSRPDIR
jgi:type II secretion system protein N